MKISYEEIAKVNEGLASVPVKGKDYVVVPQRVKAFRQLFPGGFIRTDILSHENGIVVMQAKAGYYNEGGEAVLLGTGLAFEKADSSFINKTSYIENCETSAIGRALGFLGLGIDASICSAEELVNAINNQGDSEKKENKAKNKVKIENLPPATATVTTESQLPPVTKTAKQYVSEEIAKMQNVFNIPDKKLSS